MFTQPSFPKQLYQFSVTDHPVLLITDEPYSEPICVVLLLDLSISLNTE